MQSWEVTYLGLCFPFCKRCDLWGYLVSSQISRSQWLPSHPRPRWRSMSCAGSALLNGTEEQSPQLKGIEMELSTFYLELYMADCPVANPAVNPAIGCAAVRVPPTRGTVMFFQALSESSPVMAGKTYSQQSVQWLLVPFGVNLAWIWNPLLTLTVSVTLGSLHLP